MGSWGVGMQANDTAMDAIGSFSCQARYKGKDKRQRKMSAAQFLESLFTDPDYVDSSRNWMILGMAEYMMEREVESKQLTPELKNKIDKVITKELSKRRLSHWLDRKERKGALLRFRKCLLHGFDALDKNEKMDTIIDGLGLLDKMAFHGMSREEIKEKLK